MRMITSRTALLLAVSLLAACEREPAPTAAPAAAREAAVNPDAKQFAGRQPDDTRLDADELRKRAESVDARPAPVLTGS